MMGVWHSNALKTLDCRLHTIVGRRPEPTREFAERYGYTRWTTDLAEALADEEVDAVIVAGPSELHHEHAELVLESRRDALVEIPLAMTLPDVEHLVTLAARRGRILGVVHPLRFRPELAALRERVAAGEERVRHVAGRFFIHRLENVGATGYRRSWTDNLLWHHMAHLVDCGMWILGEDVRAVHGFMPSVDAQTRIPMDAYVALETAKEQSLVCAGSYYGRERIFEVFVVTDRDSYRLDIFGSTLTTGAGVASVSSEEETCALVTADFLAAVTERREPLVSASGVLPAMSVLQEVQDAWDRRYGRRPLPGRQV